MWMSWRCGLSPPLTTWPWCALYLVLSWGTLLDIASDMVGDAPEVHTAQDANTCQKRHMQSDAKLLLMSCRATIRTHRHTS